MKQSKPTGLLERPTDARITKRSSKKRAKGTLPNIVTIHDTEYNLDSLSGRSSASSLSPVPNVDNSSKRNSPFPGSELSSGRQSADSTRSHPGFNSVRKNSVISTCSSDADSLEGAVRAENDSNAKESSQVLSESHSKKDSLSKRMQYTKSIDSLEQNLKTVKRDDIRNSKNCNGISYETKRKSLHDRPSNAPLIDYMAGSERNFIEKPDMLSNSTEIEPLEELEKSRAVSQLSATQLYLNGTTNGEIYDSQENCEQDIIVESATDSDSVTNTKSTGDSAIQLQGDDSSVSNEDNVVVDSFATSSIDSSDRSLYQMDALNSDGPKSNMMRTVNSEIVTQTNKIETTNENGIVNIEGSGDTDKQLSSVPLEELDTASVTDLKHGEARKAPGLEDKENDFTSFPSDIFDLPPIENIDSYKADLQYPFSTMYDSYDTPPLYMAMTHPKSEPKEDISIFNTSKTSVKDAASENRVDEFHCHENVHGSQKCSCSCEKKISIRKLNPSEMRSVEAEEYFGLNNRLANDITSHYGISDICLTGDLTDTNTGSSDSKKTLCNLSKKSDTGESSGTSDGDTKPEEEQAIDSAPDSYDSVLDDVTDIKSTQDTENILRLSEDRIGNSKIRDEHNKSSSSNTATPVQSPDAILSYELNFVPGIHKDEDNNSRPIRRRRTKSEMKPISSTPTNLPRRSNTTKECRKSSFISPLSSSDHGVETRRRTFGSSGFGERNLFPFNIKSGTFDSAKSSLDTTQGLMFDPGYFMSDSESDTIETSTSTEGTDPVRSILADLGVSDDIVGLKEDHFSSPDVSFFLAICLNFIIGPVMIPLYL